MNIQLSTAARAAARLAFLVLLAVGGVAAQEVTKKEDTTSGASTPVGLEAFEVTGSRIKRLDYETPVPVVTYTAAAIEEKAYSTLGEFVSSLPFSNSTAVSEFTSASAFITGASTINPRGLGANRFLTLI